MTSRNAVDYTQTLRDTSKSCVWFWIAVAAAIVIGAVLRLYMIEDQILLNDEWHGMNYVIGNKFSHLLTHFSIPGATCIPMNLYRWFLLNGFGWSELPLRLPSLAGGILGLVVFPVLINKIFNRRAAIIFAFLLAESPFMIFYSRVCRPYSIYALLGFVSVLALYLWARGGERKYGVIYAITAIGAIYFHLFAAVAVLVPIGYLLLVKIVRGFVKNPKRQDQIVPGLRAISLAAVSVIVVTSILLVPALVHSKTSTIMRVNTMTLKSITEFVCMLSGTPNRLLLILFSGLVVVGQIRLWRQIPLLGNIFVLIILVYFAVLIVFGPDLIYAAIVISRYLIVLFPMSFMLAASGADGVLKFIESVKPIKHRRYGPVLTNFAAGIFLLALLYTGPLSETYARPNNFTNHSAYQESYESPGWERSYTSRTIRIEPVMTKADLPEFYQQLSNDTGTGKIIEYPMMLGNHFNLYYYYQHFHKKKIMVGYYTELPLKQIKAKGFILAHMYPDTVLSRMSDRSKLKFRNMIDMTNVGALAESGAGYVVLHKNLMIEIIPSHLRSRKRFNYEPTMYLAQIYQDVFGPAVFENDNIIVFRIS